MTINRDFAENLRAGGDLSGSFDVTGDLATFDNLTVNTAATVPYDNSVSGLTAANIQSAITELNTLVGGGNVGSQATWNVYEFTTVGNDTQFDISSQGSPAPSYVPGYVKVYLNGLLLSESDYTAVDGSTVNFSPAIVDSGQIVSIVVMDSFNTAELLRVTSIDASASTNTLVIDSNSRVGIGIENPNRALHISSSASEQATFASSGATAGINFQPSGATVDHNRILVTSNEMLFVTNNAEHMRIDSSGNVGIGQISPNADLEIKRAGSSTIRLTNALNEQSTNDVIGEIEFYSAENSAPNDSVRADIAAINEDTLNNVALIFGTAENAGNVTERMRIDSVGNVGIGTTSPSSILTAVSGSSADETVLTIGNDYSTADTTGDASGMMFQLYRSYIPGLNDAAFIKAEKEQAWDASGDRDSALTFGTRDGATEPREVMRIDSAGNLLVGKIVTTFSTEGIVAYSSADSNGSRINITNDGGEALNLNRKTSDGDIAIFYKSSSPVGSIGSHSSSLFIADDDTGLFFNRASNNILPYRNDTGNEGVYDAALDLGRATGRFRDLYLSDNVIVGGGGSIENGEIQFVADSTRARIVGGYDTGGGGYLAFHTDTAGGTDLERARFNNAGNLSFADGKGIDFSAMTGGGTYTAGTGTSVLNDYEEGTFTPNFTIGGTTFTGFSTNSGRYVKIGDQVTVWIYSISTTGIGGLTGNCEVTNLPFVSANSNPDVWKGWTNRTGVNPGTGKSLAMFLSTNTTGLSFYISDDAGGVNTRMTHSSLPTSGTFEIPVSLTYRAKP